MDSIGARKRTAVRSFLSCFIFYVCGLVPPVPAQQNSGSRVAPYTEQVRKEFKFYPGGKLLFQAGFPGNLKIIGWNRASVLLEAEKVLYKVSPEEGKKLAEQFSIQVRFSQTAAAIRTLGPSTSGGVVEINTLLYLPRDRTDLKVYLVQGDLSIESVQGWVEANLKEGSIEAKSIAGYYSLVTQQGDLSVRMTGRHWNGVGFTAATLRGTVNLQLPIEYSAALQLETRDGNFIVDYPEQLVDGESIPLASVQNKNVRSLTASVGRGGAPIRIQTGSGNIHLTAAP